MCWRCDTRKGREESERDFERITKAISLVTRKASRGSNIHTDSHPRHDPKGRKYFRQDYYSSWVGIPDHTTELLLEPGMVVIVTKMPEDVRDKFKLLARDPEEKKLNLTKRAVRGPRARVVNIGGKIGLSFGKTGQKVFYPLDADEITCLRVVSVPR